MSSSMVWPQNERGKCLVACLYIYLVIEKLFGGAVVLFIVKVSSLYRFKIMTYEITMLHKIVNYVSINESNIHV